MEGWVDAHTWSMYGDESMKMENRRSLFGLVTLFTFRERIEMGCNKEVSTLVECYHFFYNSNLANG